MVILYSTGCPKCNILKKKFESKNIDYKENNDTDLMISKGFSEVPMVEIDDKLFNFKQAVDWINGQGVN